MEGSGIIAYSGFKGLKIRTRLNRQFIRKVTATPKPIKIAYILPFGNLFVEAPELLPPELELPNVAVGFRPPPQAHPLSEGEQ